MQLRTAEVAAALSLATDLGMRAQFEHGLRSTRYATDLGTRLGFDPDTLRSTYYVTLLLYVGCTADLDVVTGAFGDEEEFRIRVAPVAYDVPARMMRAMLPMAGRPATGPARVVSTARTLIRMPREMPRMMRAHCEVAGLHAERLGLPPQVRRTFAATYERWDGKGGPGRLRGDRIPAAVRVAHIARDLDAQRSMHGVDAAADVLRQRSGHAFDPQFVATALELEPLDADTSAWDPMLADEPGPPLMLAGEDIDGALSCLGAFAEMMSPHLRGHSAAVSDLAARAATALNLPAHEVVAVRRAGLVHDVGRVTVPVHVWEQAGPLGPDAWERVRLHAYHSGRVLNRAGWLAEIGAVVAAHHERCDGSGYHRGATLAQLPMSARVLAAADAYCAMCADRPHRAALSPDAAAAQLRRSARAGQLDSAAVEHVLGAAGHARRDSDAADLTARECEVLRLIARGAANKQVARTLGISPKTVDNHVQHIYAKTGLSTRAAATLLAMQRGLLD